MVSRSGLQYHKSEHLMPQRVCVCVLLSVGAVMLGVNYGPVKHWVTLAIA